MHSAKPKTLRLWLAEICLYTVAAGQDRILAEGLKATGGQHTSYCAHKPDIRMLPADKE